MNLSLYLDKGTRIHRLDARTKIVWLLGLFVLSVMFSNPGILFGLLVLVLGVTLMAQSLTNVRKIWVLLLLLFVYSMILWPFFVEGQTPFLEIGSHVITIEGVSHGLGMGLRLNVMLLSGILLLSTTAIEEFTQGLHRLGVPQTMGFALSLAFRWVPTLLGSVSAVVQAQRARGLDLPSGTIFSKLRQYPPLVVPLIGHTLRQTNLLAMALESKGFGPGRQRRALSESRMTRFDYLALGIMIGLVSVSIWLRLNGYDTI